MDVEDQRTKHRCNYSLLRNKTLVQIYLLPIVQQVKIKDWKELRWGKEDIAEWFEIFKAKILRFAKTKTYLSNILFVVYSFQEGLLCSALEAKTCTPGF